MIDDEVFVVIDIMFDGEFGDVGVEVVIEEFMEGEEVSYFLLVNGVDVFFIGMV